MKMVCDENRLVKVMGWKSCWVGKMIKFVYFWMKMVCDENRLVKVMGWKSCIVGKMIKSDCNVLFFDLVPQSQEPSKKRSFTRTNLLILNFKKIRTNFKLITYKNQFLNFNNSKNQFLGPKTSRSMKVTFNDFVAVQFHGKPRSHISNESSASQVSN